MTMTRVQDDVNQRQVEAKRNRVIHTGLLALDQGTAAQSTEEERRNSLGPQQPNTEEQDLM